MKPVLFWATSLLLIYFVKGQNDWYNPDGQVSPCNPSDSCHCQFTGQWELLDTYFELKKFSEELEVLENWVQQLDLTQLVQQALSMIKELDEFEARIQNISVHSSVQEYTAFEKKISMLAANVEELMQNGSSEQEILEYENRITNVTTSIDTLWKENPYAAKDDLNKQVLELRGQLNSCQRMTDGSYFRGDSLPLKLKEDWCDHYEPVSIGDSLAHGTSSRTYGNWFKDPYPVDDVNITTIWQRGYSSYNSYATFIYGQNYSEFINILAKKSSTPSAHNTRTYGLGYIMYNGSLYYHFGTEIVKYTLSNNAIHKVPLAPSSTEYLQHGTTTRIDLKVDEYGLYAVYAHASNEEKLIIRKMNPHTLETIDIWHTNRHKATVCATFMVCGKLYTLDNCWSRLDTEAHHKQYTYDTLTGKERYEDWHLTAKFGHVWMVGYNPRERLLFAWDNAHLVTYPLTWRRRTQLKEPF